MGGDCHQVSFPFHWFHSALLEEVPGLQRHGREIQILKSILQKPKISLRILIYLVKKDFIIIFSFPER